jgi:di/tricarboxylate transporter
MSNVGTTILLLPVAMNLAVQMHQDPLLFALIVAVSSSNSFIIPTHQANALIFSTGQYRVRKFVQVGGILTVAYLGIELIILNMIF